jgi:hypothetical protein
MKTPWNHLILIVFACEALTTARITAKMFPFFFSLLSLFYVKQQMHFPIFVLHVRSKNDNGGAK